MTPRTVGRYQLLELLGKGGMGAVYLAFDPALERQVALKLLALPGGPERRRFRREVQVAARLSHRHIVTIYDVDLENDPPYVVMELLTGGTLETYLKDHHLAWREAFTLLQPLCRALAHAHQIGVIHRDIKPANILFSGGAEQTLKLADFGLARRQGSEQLTGAGAVMGTLGYVSPEQAAGQDVSAASDIFPVGIILFEAIAGFNPMRGQSWSETLARIASPDPLDLEPLHAKAPADVIALIGKATAKDHRKRYLDAALLEQDIARLLDRQPEEDAFPILTDSTPAARELQIENPLGLSLPAGGADILRQMFAGYGRVAIKDEMVGGRSGGRIFLVRPIRHDGTPELPAVVKMAPLHLIEQEWRAYQNYVRAQLAGVAEIQGRPVMPPGVAWGGLRYPLVGGGDFAIESLFRYFMEAGPVDIRYLLERRLFKRMGEKWRHNFAVAEFRLGDSYDAVLPVNLLIRPGPLPSDKTTVLVQPGMAGSFQVGDPILVTDLVVSELDEAGQSVTLNRLIGSQPRFYPSYRLRLQPVADVHHYHTGQSVDLEGVVTATRQELLLNQARDALGASVDLSAETLPNGWPNPLHRLAPLLAETLNVRTGNIHGDFNLDNILVDPATREVYLIDFALARRDHVLHDLLRMEKDVITRLLPESLLAAALPVTALDQFFAWVDDALAQERPSALPALPHPALEKPLLIVYLIRRAARDLLFDPRRWAEYETGLTLYLLGALKFKDLTDHARQVAFWGAAALQHRLSRPMLTQGPLSPATVITPEQPARRRTRLLFPIGLVLFLLLLLLAFWVSRMGLESRPIGPQLATIISFTDAVEVRRVGGDQLQQASFGMPLYEGDVVITYAGSTVRVLCEDGLLFDLPGGSNMTVDCREAGSQWLVARLDMESARLAPPDESAPPVTATPPASQESNAALLLSPRNTWTLETEPAFHWLAVPGADSYRLTVTSADGDTWQVETEVAGLPYPADAPPLLPGSVNQVVLEVLGDESLRDETTLRVLDEAAATALAADEAAVRDLELDEATELYLLAQLYERNGLTDAAINLLEALVSGSGNTSPYLWRQLGDLYASIGLLAQAESSYQSALTLTPVTPEELARLSPSQTPPLPSATPAITPAQDVTLPVSPGTPVPQPSDVISPANAGRVVALARWGDGALSEVACSPDSRSIAAALANGVVLYDSSSLADERLLRSGAVVHSITFSPDGLLLAGGSSNGAIQLWRLADGAQVAEVAEHDDRVWNIAFSPDGRWLASGSLDNTVRLWQVDGEMLRESAIFDDHAGPVRSVAFSPDGQRLASASDDGLIHLRRVSDGTLLTTLAGHTGTVRSVAFSPDGRRLASGSDDGAVRIWQLPDGALLATLTEHERAVHSVRFSPDGQLLASAGLDTNLRLWSVAAGQLLNTLQDPAGWLYSISFCDEGLLLLSGSSDGALYLWGLEP